MSYLTPSLTSPTILTKGADVDEIIDLKAKNDDLKGQLNVAHLQLKDNSFTMKKKEEAHELQLDRLANENKVLKEKMEKSFEGQRILETQNSTLEDRLLKIVEKYEEEQKSLFEELTIAHSKLVELKLNIAELEEQKEQYRNDCNVAVNLLQTNPGDFVNHSYNSLPINLKDRLKSILSTEEILELQEQGFVEEERKSKENSLFKLPIFQPSAAAAMMYNMQNVNVQREIQRHITHTEPQIISQNHLISLDDWSSQYQTEDISRSNGSIERIGESTAVERNSNLSLDNLSLNSQNGKVASSLIAQVLRKEPESPSKKAEKLFPYICLRCKKQTVLTDQSTQYNSTDLTSNNLKELNSTSSVQRNIINFHKAKTVGSNLSNLKDDSLSTYQSNLKKMQTSDNSDLNAQSYKAPDIPGLTII